MKKDYLYLGALTLVLGAGLAGIIGLSLLEPQSVETSDINGDGRPDITVKTRTLNYRFIQKEDGNYVPIQEYNKSLDDKLKDLK